MPDEVDGVGSSVDVCEDIDVVGQRFVSRFSVAIGACRLPRDWFAGWSTLVEVRFGARFLPRLGDSSGSENMCR